MKKYCKLLIIIMVVCIGAISLFVLIKLDSPKVVSETEETVSLTGEIQTLSKNFTCTGLTWDSKEKVFWIADYGASYNSETKFPRLVKMDQNLNEIGYINLSGALNSDDNLQGISYDISNDSIWIAVGDSCKNISKSGIIINEFSTDEFVKYKSNGLCVDGESIWVLCYSKYLLKYNKDGKLLEKINFNYKDQDMITLYENQLLITVGADYSSNNNFILSYNLKTKETTVKFKPIDSYAVEGLAVVDGNLYVANDGFFHDAKIKSSYIVKYKIE